MKSIKEAGDLKGKSVLVRIDIDDHGVNTLPVEALKPTLSYLKMSGARTILLGHIGRDGHISSSKIFDILKKEIELSFVPDITGDIAKTSIDKMQDGEVVLLENVRGDKREMENDEAFSKELASLADIYVNDAFSVSHREHASIAGVTKYLPSYAGLRLLKEIDELSKILSPESPSMFILSGAKIETKLPLVEKFLTIYDHVFIGGVLANDIFKAKGFETGVSVTSNGSVDMSSLLNNEKILIPSDVIVREGSKSTIKKANEVLKREKIVDAGPETVATLSAKIKDMNCVVWNGPLGEYEIGFDKSTKDLAVSIAESRAYSVIGGGDTLNAIESLNIEEKYSFVSTGGGAMLEFLLHGTLPGIEALK